MVQSPGAKMSEAFEEEKAWISLPQALNFLPQDLDLLP
jgi:hypothetical protein